MRNKKGKSLRKLSWVVGTRVAGAVLLVLAFLAMSGCTPDIANDWKQNTDETILFDLQAVPPIAPQPTYIAMNAKTGKVDLSQAGIPLPKGITWNSDKPCAEFSSDGTCTDLQSLLCDNLTTEQQSVMSIASCNVYKYLTSLDGFPTAAPITAQSTKQIDTDTVKVATGTLSVFCTDRTNQFDITKLKIYSDPELQIDSKKSQTVKDAWDLTINTNPPANINSNCVVAIRGHENGIKSKDGAKSFISAQTFLLLKEKDSLTCGHTKGDEGLDVCQTNPPALIPEICKYYPMVAGAPGNEGKTQIFISGLMCVLEYLRTNMVAPVLKGVDTLTGSTTMSDEAAIAWAYPTHSTPTIENIPGKREPTLVAYDPLDPTNSNKIYITVNGTVDPTQLVRGYYNYGPPPTKPITYKTGTVFLIQSHPLTDKPAQLFPTYDVTFDSATKQIVISNVNPPLVETSSYLVFVTKGTGNPGDPKVTNMIPFMSTILVQSTGPLYDMDTEKLLVTTLSGLSDATPSDRALAKSAECQRLDLHNQFYDLYADMFGQGLIGLALDKVLFVGLAGTPYSPTCD